MLWILSVCVASYVGNNTSHINCFSGVNTNRLVWCSHPLTYGGISFKTTRILWWGEIFWVIFGQDNCRWYWEEPVVHVHDSHVFSSSHIELENIFSLLMIKIKVSNDFKLTRFANYIANKIWVYDIFLLKSENWGHYLQY